MALLPIELNFENAVHYHSEKFPPKSLDYQRLIPGIANATAALARYDQMLKNMHNSEILLAPLRSQEAVISSRMEGTVSTIDEIFRYEADYDEQIGSAGNTRSEVIETLLYQRALKAAQAAMQEGQPLSQFLIRGAHERLLSFGRGATKSPGQYKTEQNYLADRTMRNILFVPIGPERLQEGMDALFKYLEESNDIPLIKAAISHVEFESLHPFKDGNGRIGRMIITLLLWKSQIISAPHFYISGFLEENKDVYIDTMRAVSEKDAWTEWCIFFLEAVEKQAVRNLQIAESISDLYETMKQEFAESLSSKWSVAALDFVFTNPVFRNSKFTRSSGIPAPTAMRFARVMTEKKFLTVVEEPSGRRSALYAFEPLLQLVRV